MGAARKPTNEDDRLSALRRYDILDTPPEGVFDDLVWLAAKICDVPMAALSLVDTNRQWFKSMIGLSARETSRDVAFCAHAILDDAPLVVNDATDDPRFADNPLVHASPRLRFYAGMPLHGSGHKLGTLCVIDQIPRELTDLQLKALEILSRQVETQLEVRLHACRLAAVQRQKDELMSLLVHDLKNPLSSMLMNAQFLVSGNGDAALNASAAMDIEVGAENMQSMICNILELARSESGELQIAWTDVRMRELLAEVEKSVAMRAEVTGHRFVTSCTASDDLVQGDRELLRRLVENLVDNAFRYTRRDRGVVEVEISAREEGFLDIAVSDEGRGVPEELRGKIFERYARLDPEVSKSGRTGFGLGLASCRMITDAHHGRIWVESNHPQGSVFRVRLPRTRGGAA